MTIFNGRKAKISGTGVYIPEKIMKNTDFEKFLDTSDSWIYERTGIKERHFAADGERCSDLAYNAAVAALNDAKMSPETLDMIIVATNTPDSTFPSMSCKVQGRLGAVNAGAFDVLAGCVGGVAAIQTAVSGVVSGLWNNVLVVASEKFKDYVDWNDRSTCILFGDGAGACVLSTSNEGEGNFISSKISADGTKHDFLSNETENSGDPHVIKMKGQDVFKYVSINLPKFIENFCEESKITPENVDFWIMHQANTRIIDSVFKRVGISIDKTLLNLEQYGNTSAASVMIALDESMKKGCVKQGDKVCFVAFGAGMTLGALLYEV